MMNDSTQLALVCAVSVAINSVHAIDAGKEPILTVVAGGLAFVALSAFGGVTGRYDVAIAVALVFLVSAIVLRGLPLIRKSAQLVS
jgi:hypothetical protein